MATSHSQRVTIQRRLVFLVQRQKCLFVTANGTLEQRFRLLVQNLHLAG